MKEGGNPLNPAPTILIFRYSLSAKGAKRRTRNIIDTEFKSTYYDPRVRVDYETTLAAGTGISGFGRDNFGSISLGYNHVSGFGTSASYDYRTGSTTVGVSHMMHHSSGYFDQTTTGLNWNSRSGFSTSLDYSFNAGMRDFQELSPYEQIKRMHDMENQRNAMAGLMESMGNNWNNVMQGVGSIVSGMWRDEENKSGDSQNISEFERIKRRWMNEQGIRFHDTGDSGKNILYDSTDVSEVIRELDSEMEFSKSIPSDVSGEGESIFLKTLAKIFPKYAAFDIIAIMNEHKESPAKVAELVAEKKVKELTKEIIELEAKAVDESYQVKKEDLETRIGSLKKRIQLFEETSRYFENGHIIELDETLRNDTNVVNELRIYEENKRELLVQERDLSDIKSEFVRDINNLNIIYDDLSNPNQSSKENDNYYKVENYLKGTSKK